MYWSLRPLHPNRDPLLKMIHKLSAAQQFSLRGDALAPYWLMNTVVSYTSHKHWNYIRGLEDSRMIIILNGVVIRIPFLTNQPVASSIMQRLQRLWLRIHRAFWTPNRSAHRAMLWAHAQLWYLVVTLLAWAFYTDPAIAQSHCPAEGLV